MGKTQGLSRQERAFCRWYAGLQDPREAAVHAGYCGAQAEEIAASLLDRPPIRREVDRQRRLRRGDLRLRILTGLERLAFGSVGDAVALFAAEEGEMPDAGELDLFRVSEIKRPKGGGLEVRFYDRQKALETLWQLSQQEETPLSGLYQALADTARQSASASRGEALSPAAQEGEDAHG